MKKKFEFEFIDRSSDNEISFEYDDYIDEKMEIIQKNETLILYANRQGFLALAKTFIKIALGNYQDGLHVHLKKDFDADRHEVIICVLNK